MVIPEFPPEIFEYGTLLAAPFIIYSLYKNRHLIGKDNEAMKKRGRIPMVMAFVFMILFSLGFILIIIKYATDPQGFDNAWNLLCWLYLLGFVVGSFFVWLVDYRNKHNLQQQ